MVFSARLTDLLKAVKILLKYPQNDRSQLTLSYEISKIILSGDYKFLLIVYSLDVLKHQRIKTL